MDAVANFPRGMFAPTPRSCKCGAMRVDTSDTVETDGRGVCVHGVAHCYTYNRAPIAGE